MISANVAIKALDRMAASMRFFPADEGVREIVAEELAAICSTDDQVDWLARRMSQVYHEWPGVEEMRACYCARYPPADGREVYSSAFPDGIPSERPAPVEVHALPPADVRLAIQRAAKRLPEARL